jgi:HAD superfamily hydrolase (TIGR01450 family)
MQAKPDHMTWNQEGVIMDSRGMLARVAKARAIALDLDGVVYQGSQALPGSIAAIALLQRLEFEVYFVTNNSSKTRAAIAAKLGGMGIRADEDKILTSGYAAAALVNRLMQEGKRQVVVIGSDDLRAELSQAGMEIVAAAPCDFLVVGLDTSLTYEKLCTALDALLDGALFVACNLDPVFPADGGRLFLGCGPAVVALELASRRKPDYVAGKPYTFLLEILAKRGRVQPHEILVVGDSLESDIAMANKYGALSVLIRQDNDARLGASWRFEQQPGLVVQSLDELARLIASAIPARSHGGSVF